MHLPRRSGSVEEHAGYAFVLGGGRVALIMSMALISPKCLAWRAWNARRKETGGAIGLRLTYVESTSEATAAPDAFIGVNPEYDLSGPW